MTSLATGALIALSWSTPAAAAGTDELARDDLGIAALSLAVAGWLAFYGVRERWGREARHEAPDGDDDGGPRRPPDDPPAVADALRRRGAVGSTAVGIVILDLARRGYLTIIEDRKGGFLGGDTEWRFRREETPRDSLRPYENAVFTRLFASGSDVWLSDLEGWARNNRPQARVFIERVERSIVADLGERGYLERGRRLPVVLNLSAAGVVALVSLTALGFGSLFGLVGLASAAGQVVAGRRLRRRTAVGADRARQWTEVAETLEAVDEHDEPVAESAEEWERCLVFAVTLDVGDEFIRGLRDGHADVLGDEDFAGWYQSVRTDGHRLDSLPTFIGTLATSLSGAVETVRVPSKLASSRR